MSSSLLLAACCLELEAFFIFFIIFWPSVPGCIFFGSILVRHRLTQDLTALARVFNDMQLDPGSSLYE